MTAHALIVSPLYVGLCALVFVVLSARVIRGRNRRGVNLGHGGHADLETAMRVRGNFAEYVPLALLLIAQFAAASGAG